MKGVERPNFGHSARLAGLRGAADRYPRKRFSAPSGVLLDGVSRRLLHPPTRRDRLAALRPPDERENLKLVIGIVRPEKANDVLEALYRAEVRGLSMSRVQGHGGELDRVETYRGTTVKVGLSDKVRFEIAVSDDFVQPTIDALCEGARTGEVGDGKIFVLAAGARGADPHRRDRPRRRHAGGFADGHAQRSSRRQGRYGRHRLDARRDGARPADDARPRALLRGARALEEHAQHVHDVHRGDRGRHGHLGGGRLLARVQRGQRHHRRASTTRSSTTSASTPLEGPTIPHLVFFAFQATFCIITTALVSGAVVERMRFSAFLVFAALWSVLVYSVLAHWGFGAGWLFNGGTLDFAGGIAVEMASGFSALAAALVVGARKDYGRQALLPAQRRLRSGRRRAAVVRLVRVQRRQWVQHRRTQRAGLHQHAADAGVHAARVVPARRDPRPADDRDRRGDGDHRRLRGDHARRADSSSPGCAMLLGCAVALCPATR